MTDRCERLRAAGMTCPRPAEYVVVELDPAGDGEQVRVCRAHLGSAVADLVDHPSSTVSVAYSWVPRRPV